MRARLAWLLTVAISVSLLASVAGLSVAGDAGAKTKFRKAAGFGPPPAKGDCLGYTDPRGCIWNARETEFSLSSHIVHVGGQLSGTGTSVFAQVPVLAGAGLKLKRKRITPGKGFTATWKAVADTGSRWQYGVGIMISLLADHPSYLESDYYAVVDKRAAILEGHVTDLDKSGVEGMKVLIDGLGSVADQNFYATTAQDGYYMAKLKAGNYRVCVREVTAAGKPGREICSTAAVVSPAKKAITVRAKKTATANFVVQKSAHTELKLDPASLPATGLAGSKMTVRTLDRWGQPLANQAVIISPNVRGSAAADLAVPALVCDAAGGARWPQSPPAGDSARDPYTARTDATGTYEATIAGGTVAGPWTISARNDTTRTPRGYAASTLTITGQSPVPLGTLRTQVNDGIAGGGVPTLDSFGGDGDFGALLNWMTALRALPFWQGVEVMPIAGAAANERAMLLAPQGSISVDAAGNISGDLASARIIEPAGGGASTAQEQVAMGGAAGTLPVGWTVTDWVAGTAPGTTLGPAGAPRINAAYWNGGRLYGGFPYPTGAAKGICR